MKLVAGAFFFYNACMPRFLAFAVFFASIFSPSYLRADNIHRSEIYAGYFAIPEDSSGPLPVVILIHEWWGLDKEMRSRADRFAEKGFAAVAVDLFSGQTASNAMEALSLSEGLTEERALEDLKNILSYLQKRSDIDPKRIGVAGWGMGAKLALPLAASDARVKAVALFYAVPELYEKWIPDLKVPLLGAFGMRERGVPQDTVRNFKFRLEQSGKRARILVYEDAGYSFATSGDLSYQGKAAAESWQEAFVFFKQNLS